MPQQSLSDFVNDMEKAGLLVRIKEEKRVDELPAVMEADIAALIREAPRTWKEILQHYNGQPYKVVYGAFSNLRHQLGRCDDEPWYRYTFSDTDCAVEAPQRRRPTSIPGTGRKPHPGLGRRHCQPGHLRHPKVICQRFQHEMPGKCCSGW